MADKEDNEDFESVDIVDEDENDTHKAEDTEAPVNDDEGDAGRLGDEEQVMAGTEPQVRDDVVPPKKQNKIQRFFAGYWRHKKWTLPLTILVLIGIIFAVPATRYPVLALGLKRDFTVTVNDSKTHTPVSGATLTLDGHTLTTNNAGKVTFKAKVGSRQLTVDKQYYQISATKVFVGVKGQGAANVELVATGRQVPIKVVNKISGAPVANAEIKVLDTEAKTDASGKATIVLPTDSPTQSVAISVSGYNTSNAKVQVTSDVIAANTFQLTPSGRIYFLSNLSGNIDVVSANLDGTNRQTVLAGTGSEEANNTVLLATTDWKYLALLSKRDGGNDAKLFLINTATRQTTTMDSGTASFQLVGWSGHHFAYVVNRDNVRDWQNGQQALKSFNADTGALTTIDQTTASGTSEQNFAGQNFGYGNTTVSIVGNKILYTKQWDGESLSGKQNQIFSVSTDGTNKQILKSITLGKSSGNFYSLVYNPETVYVQAELYSDKGPASTYYIYNAGNNTLTQSNTITDSTFQQYQQVATTYLVSPSGSQSFWSQQRDGKNSLFVGDYNGGNGKQIASLSDYQTFGWYTDSYLLVEKGGSELYVMPVAGGNALKLSDYYKPPHNYYGYGGGYGGL